MENENTALAAESNQERNNQPILLGSNNAITSLFKNPKTAEAAYGSLLEEGYKQEDITLVMSEDTRNNHFADNKSSESVTDLGNKTLEGLGVGAAVGGSVGAVAAALAALGTTLAIPGLGIIISGALAASFAGAGAGAAIGGLIGTLIGSEIPDEQAKVLEEGLKNGGVIMGVKAKSEEEREDLRKKWLKLQNEGLFNQAA